MPPWRYIALSVEPNDPGHTVSIQNEQHEGKRSCCSGPVAERLQHYCRKVRQIASGENGPEYLVDTPGVKLEQQAGADFAKSNWPWWIRTTIDGSKVSLSEPHLTVYLR